MMNKDYIDAKANDQNALTRGGKVLPKPRPEQWWMITDDWDDETWRAFLAFTRMAGLRVVVGMEDPAVAEFQSFDGKTVARAHG